MASDVLTQIARGRRRTRELLMESPTPGSPDDLTAPVRDAVALFEELGIEHAVVGGVAAMLHGRARYTDDLDFIAASGHEATLQAHPESMRRHGFDSTCTSKLYHTSGTDIDLWKDEHVPGMLKRAEPVVLGGVPTRVVTPEDLIAMKLRAGRAQDVYDITEVVRRRREEGGVDARLLRELVTVEQYAEYEAVVAKYMG